MSVSSELFLEYKKRPGRAVLARLLERHQDAVYSLCYRVLRHPQDAEDACQDVLLEVSRQVDAIEQPASFAGWLYRTALHTALDLKRKRGRQRVRDASAAPAAPTASDDAHEALHRGLAELDETTRMLVVEHYLAQRPLRELADERGCSEVAVWKRLRNARERLRRSLGSAAVVALEGAVKVQAPASVARTLALQGGLLMAVKGGIKLAIVAPLLLLAGAGMIVVMRQPGPPAIPKELPRKPAPPSAVSPAPAPEPVAKPPSPTPPTAPKPVGRKPYPLALPLEGGSDAARQTWRRLSEKRMDLDLLNEPLAKILQIVAAELGITVILESPANGEEVSFKVKELIGDSCLRLLLYPRERNYEIRPDGTVVVAFNDKIKGGYEQVGRAIQLLQLEVNQVHQELERGWNGIGDESERRDSTDRALRTKKILLPQGTTTWTQVLERLHFEHGQTVLVDANAATAVEAVMNRPFESTVEEPKFGTLVERIARELGLSWCIADNGTVLLASEEDVVKARAEAEARVSQHRRDMDRLSKPVVEAGPMTVADLLDSIARSHGLRIMPEEEVWESSATVTVASGSTVRQALDQIRPLGFRWAIRNGSIYVVR